MSRSATSNVRLFTIYELNERFNIQHAISAYVAKSTSTSADGTEV